MEFRLTTLTFLVVSTCISWKKSDAFLLVPGKPRPRFVGSPFFSTRQTSDIGKKHNPKWQDLDSLEKHDDDEDEMYWEIGPTRLHPQPRPLTRALREALLENRHLAPDEEDLGRGIYLTTDWRKAWYTYQSPPDHPDLIDETTGQAGYDIDEMEGTLPDDLVGILYRNGAGKFGVGGERVQHVLDADGLIFSIHIPPPTTTNHTTSTTTDSSGKRRVTFRSQFVQTKGFLQEQKANQFTARGVFGTGPRGLPFLFPPPQKGINADPSPLPLVSRMAGSAFHTDIKNTANTHVISFAGKLLALFEAGLPHALDPHTLDTLGEDTMGGTLGGNGKMALQMTKEFQRYQPDFMGGAFHTAHPKRCPRTGHLVAWHYSLLLPGTKSLELTFNEWSPDDFSLVAQTTFVMNNTEVAPHDMALTENCVVMMANSLSMNQLPFLLGIKGPAASMTMKGRDPVYAHIFPRPTAPQPFEPFVVQIPPCFGIHFSHAYEHETTGNLVAFFSGWPPSDSTDFLGAWGGFCPNFAVIPPTHLWRLEIDPRTQQCVDLRIAPDAVNACSEHVVCHPNFQTRQANYVYAITSNLLGDSSAPMGYTRHCVEDGNKNRTLQTGDYNKEVDAYWFGSRCFTDEPLVVPKQGGNPNDERDAYLLGMVFDAVQQRSFLSIFDLQQDLRQGPVCKLWLKSHIPHGLHGCFATDGPGTSSVFC